MIINPHSNTRDALSKHVDNDDKTTVAICDTGSNYKSKVIIINESGLYSLILSSKLPQAKAFKRWVTAEVQHCNNCNSGQCSERTTRTKHDVARDCEEPSLEIAKNRHLII